MTQNASIAALEKNGFAVLDELVPANLLQDFELEIARLSQSCGQRIGIAGTGDDGLLGAFRRGGAYRGILYQLIQGLPALQRIGNHLAKADAIGAVLQHYRYELPAFSQSMRVDIPNEPDFLLPPHQDYASMRSHKAFRIWLPLRDANTRNGTMAVYPATHRQGVFDHSSGDPRYPAVPDSALPEHQVEIEAAAGTGILFDMLLVHRSIANRSNRIKFTLTFTVQDLAEIADPDDRDDPVGQYFHLHRARSNARKAAS